MGNIALSLGVYSPEASFFTICTAFLGRIGAIAAMPVRNNSCCLAESTAGPPDDSTSL